MAFLRHRRSMVVQAVVGGGDVVEHALHLFYFLALAAVGLDFLLRVFHIDNGYIFLHINYIGHWRGKSVTPRQKAL